ncbi:MAG: spirocyclase AveC family protein [Propionibacteriales bacterium]|nr:spirocyclase AveC family protein [Propionibacteriales bacterium]
MFTSSRPAPPQTQTPPRWGAAHYLALLAVPLLAYEGWTLVTWLASDPHVVTKGRDVGSTSWWWAKALEVGAVTLAVTLLVQSIRDSRRSGEMTFDLKLWIALLMTSFWDSVTNVVQPIWFYSSNFVNLNEWWGHAPGFISPAGGHEPFPVVALVFLYPCFVLESRLANRAWAALARRRPEISTVQQLLAGLAMALVVGAGISMLFVLPHLWAGPGMGPMIIDTDSYRWSVAEFLYVGTWSTTICALRFFTNAKGQAITERGLDAMSPGKRALVSTLATTAWCSLAVIIYSSLVTVSGFHATSYPTDYPEHLPNVVCDIPGDPDTTGSAYGPCPGSPGFRIPLN